MELEIVEYVTFAEFKLQGDLKDGKVWFENREKIAKVISGKKCPALALNMKEVGSITSMGIGSLVKFSRAIQAAGGRVGLVAVSPMVKSAIKMTGLDKVLEFYDCVERFKTGVEREPEPV